MTRRFANRGKDGDVAELVGRGVWQGRNGVKKTTKKTRTGVEKGERAQIDAAADYRSLSSSNLSFLARAKRKTTTPSAFRGVTKEHGKGKVQI